MRSSTYRAEEITTPAPREVYNFRVYLVTLIACFGAVIFGYDLAFIGTTLSLKSFQRDFRLIHSTAAERDEFAANIVSLLQAGCFFGSLAAGPGGDYFGRKITLISSGVLFLIGSCMQTWSSGREGLMFAGRAIGGLGVGGASMVVPLYVAEISPPAIRGRLVGLYEVCVQAGTCIGFWINYGVNRNMASNSAQWMTPFAVQLIPGGLLVIGMLLMPESPRWLARFRSRESALKVLSQVRGLPQDHAYVREEMAHIFGQMELEENLGIGKGFKAELKELGKKGYRNRVVLGVTLFVFMQMAGSNAINYYSPRIFASVGLTGTNTGLYATGIYGIVRFIAVCISMLYVVDRFGRKPMLLYGSALMAFCMWFIGSDLKLANPVSQGHVSGAGYAACVMIYVYAVGFCFSWAGVPWIYCSEIFPLRIRSICVALTTATHWLLNFVIARSVPYMLTNIKYGTYFVFAACLTLAVPFVFFFLPETKGLALEDMDVLFGVEGAYDSRNGHVDEQDMDKDGKVKESENVDSEGNANV